MVERTTGYTMLVQLPEGHKAEQVRGALTTKMKMIPEILRASLTWDQGIKMRDRQRVSVAADVNIYFCDPHSPWQRATHENTDGLLRQYLPKAPTYQCTAPWTSTGSRPSSTTDRKPLARLREADRGDRTTIVAMTAWIRLIRGK
jgi:hypothetical protein